MIDFADLPPVLGQPLVASSSEESAKPDDQRLLAMVVKLYNLGATPMNHEAKQLLDRVRQQGRI